MNNHHPCSMENKHFGAWERVEKPFPYGWFFAYYQLKAMDKHTGELLSTYFDRKNKLDKLFDWICEKLSSRKPLQSK